MDDLRVRAGQFSSGDAPGGAPMPVLGFNLNLKLKFTGRFNFKVESCFPSTLQWHGISKETHTNSAFLYSSYRGLHSYTLRLPCLRLQVGVMGGGTGSADSTTAVA
jgi:hypothetical protein